MKKVLLFALASLAVLSTGCSTSQCESVCASANDCTVAQRAADTDCPEYCNDVETMQDRARAAGAPACDAEFTAHLSCWEKNSAQVCDSEFTDCAESATAWRTCLAEYCAKADVNEPSCSKGKTTLLGF